MSGSESFLFERPVGIIEEATSHHGYRDANVRIEMVQNGFELTYANKKFVTKTLKETLKLMESWFEKMAKEAGKSKEKTESNSGHEES
ncbi:MAG: hypothetical protein ACTSW1_05485 [Candidatus Hodarchaeales archaeon]